MNRRLATPLVLLAVLTLAVPASAKHKKPETVSYAVTAPVPFVVEGDSHCSEGVEGATKNTRAITLPDRGVLQIELSGFLGDWVLELFDAKGRLLGQGVELTPTDTAPVRKVTYKKATKGQKVKIAACNFAGSPNARVKYTFTYA